MTSVGRLARITTFKSSLFAAAIAAIALSACSIPLRKDGPFGLLLAREPNYRGGKSAALKIDRTKKLSTSQCVGPFSSTNPLRADRTVASAIDKEPNAIGMADVDTEESLKFYFLYFERCSEVQGYPVFQRESGGKD